MAIRHWWIKLIYNVNKPQTYKTIYDQVMKQPCSLMSEILKRNSHVFTSLELRGGNLAPFDWTSEKPSEKYLCGFIIKSGR